MGYQKQYVVGSEEVALRSNTGTPPQQYCSCACVDWRGRPADPAKHGGPRAAISILVLQAFEIMAIAAVGNNLITYVFNDMHYTLPKSANIVTNFVGTTFLLSLLGGFVSDSYIGSFWSLIFFGCIELLGYILITVQAHVPWMKPSYCDMLSESIQCKQPKSSQALILYLGLYLIALGSGCMKPNIVSHGGYQFNGYDQKERRQLSTYFNLAYLSFSVGELIALTLIVWIQNHCGRDVGFAVSAGVMVLALLSVTVGVPYYRNKLPQGSVFTRIAHVGTAAFYKRKLNTPSSPEMLFELRDNAHQLLLLHTDQFRFLDKASIIEAGDAIEKDSSWKLCTVTQVEQVKLILRVIPIFACTIITNCVLAQLQTFSVQQGSTMNTRITDKFHIPSASLQAIPYMTMLMLVPLYDRIFVPFARKITGNETGITQLQRIGMGLVLSTISMAIAAMVEAKRKTYAANHISIFWIAPQFLIYGVSEMLTAVGLIEFFYGQSPEGMQSLLTALTYCSFSFGFFFSSVLVSTVDKITATESHGGWLSYNDLNKDHLDLFYWLLSALSLLNFFNYIFWARWYSYNKPFLPRPSKAAIGDNSDEV